MEFIENQVITLNSEKVTLEQLVKELEKIDSKLNEFSFSSTWKRDINVIYGGGFAEAKKGTNVNKEIYKNYPWTNILRIPSSESRISVLKSLGGIVDSGIKYNYDKALDKIVYRGIEEEKVYGLTNNPSVKKKNITSWKSKDGESILKDINEAIIDLLKNTKIDRNNIEICVLLPTEQYEYIINKTIGENNILTYILESNVAKRENIELNINPCKYCIEIATNGEDRMVAYIKNAISISIPQKLIRALTQENKKEKEFLSSYVALIEQVKFYDTNSIRYYDGV
ncbi:hypothetical protein CLPUN_42210 [Clostridium puniceum]|uniref:Uncharacterized protein n=1 Tax=Clostridium puniceum TaxID=29367 RepID=A0A1S8T8A8_9CLOT|nr:major capsid family protein [Clostridium puniceum]OOM73983.1 hypothetical protein CLPUN_42210 [Clostridium puniceum]